jgi:hypothetical protein
MPQRKAIEAGKFKTRLPKRPTEPSKSPLAKARNRLKRGSVVTIEKKRTLGTVAESLQIPAEGVPDELGRRPVYETSDGLVVVSKSELRAILQRLTSPLGERRPGPNPTSRKSSRTKTVGTTPPGSSANPSGSAAPARRRPFEGFDHEKATYERLKPKLIKSAQGKFVVIVGEVMLGPLESDQEAEQAGYARFGLGPLFIKQVLAQEPVVELTRFVAP